MEAQANALTVKTAELEAEMKASGLWQKELPVWVHGYNDSPVDSKTDFAQWLQFVFIPNHLQKNNAMPVAEKNLIVLHAIKYFGDDLQKGKLLRILIELDALL